MFKMVNRRVKKLIAWAIALAVVGLMAAGGYYIAAITVL